MAVMANQMMIRLFGHIRGDQVKRDNYLTIRRESGQLAQANLTNGDKEGILL